MFAFHSTMIAGGAAPPIISYLVVAGGGGGYGPSNGGSGVVIIRYASTYPAATSTTGSPTITVSGGFREYKFTSTGIITF